MDIAVIGSTMTDLVTHAPRLPRPGETLTGTSFAQGFGGKGANQAVAAARLGSRVLLLTRVGDDAHADASVANFAAQGIDTSHVLRTPGTSSGVAPIVVDEQGRNAIVIVKGANDHLDADDIDTIADELADCRLLVLQLEVPLASVAHAVRVANRAGVPVLLNPAPAAPELDLAELGRIEWFVPNESELALLTGCDADDLDAVTAAARQLLRHDIGNVLVTLGERGVLWVHPEGHQLVTSPRVQAVDTTGAGDAFIGAFSHALVHDQGVEQALDFACRYAADSVTRHGTQASYASAEDFHRQH